MGIGFGGFVDGIVFHEILQWHHMLTGQGDFPMSTVRGLEGNTVADGLFHVGTWIVLALGMIVTLDAWRRGRLAPPWRGPIGLRLVGWGAFAVAGGPGVHQTLGIHHVRDDLGGPLSWDIGFLVFGALLVIVGIALAGSVERGAVERVDGPERAPTDEPSAVGDDRVPIPVAGAWADR